MAHGLQEKEVLLRWSAKNGIVAEAVTGPAIVGRGGEDLMELNALLFEIREWSMARNRVAVGAEGYNWPFLQYEEETGRGKTNAF